MAAISPHSSGERPALVTTQVLGFDSQDVEVVPGTTSLGPSLAVMAEARGTGRAEFRVRNYANRRDNPGTLRRVGIEKFPVLLNGRRVALPAVHMQGQLGPPGHLRPWAFWFFEDPMQPITLKVYYGAEGAPESARAEWLRQVVRIDVPDPDGGLHDLELAFGSPANAGSGTGAQTVAIEGEGEGEDGGRGAQVSPAASEANGEGDGQGDGGGTDGAGAVSGRASANSNGSGAGAGAGGGARAGTGQAVGIGRGATAGTPRAATGTCRVVVPGVYFEFDSDELNPASAPWIDLVARLLERHPDWTVTIEGHTDSIGDTRYNQGLSERRATALRRECWRAMRSPGRGSAREGSGPPIRLSRTRVSRDERGTGGSSSCGRAEGPRCRTSLTPSHRSAHRDDGLRWLSGRFLVAGVLRTLTEDRRAVMIHRTTLHPLPGALSILLAFGCVSREPLDPSSTDIPSASTGLNAAKTAADIWTARSSMPTARHRLAATAVDGVIYAVGGESGVLSPLATVESFATGSNRWATRAPLPQPRSAPSGAGAIDGVLYVAGGLDAAGQATTSLYAYEQATDSWSTKAPMPIAGACGVSGVIDGRLYVYTNTSNCIETDDHDFVRYNPATNSWTVLTLPAKVHYLPTGGSINGRFYLAGDLNFTNGTSGRYVEAYNPVTDQWSSRALAPTARYATAGRPEQRPVRGRRLHGHRVQQHARGL